MANRHLITREFFDEIGDYLEFGKQTLPKNVTRVYTPEINDFFKKVNFYIKSITGFNCGEYEVTSKVNESTVKLQCYCPKLKLNFYFESVFEIPGREFLYHDLRRIGTYGRYHRNHLQVYEAIRTEKKIIDHELDISMLQKSNDEIRSYLVEQLHWYTLKYPFVGSYVDSNFPVPDETEEEISDETAEIQRRIMSMLYPKFMVDDSDDHHDDRVF